MDIPGKTSMPKTMQTLRPGVLLLLAVISMACSNEPDAASPVDSLTRLHTMVDSAIQPMLDTYQIPGMAVALTIDGQSYFFNYGVADLATGRPVSEHTLFEVGSVSKTVAAALTTFAQVTGVLSLEDRPSQFLPALADSPVDSATLMHLGTYTAGGLPLQFPDEVSDHDLMLQYYQQWQPDAAPGLIRRYSNPSIGLMGHLTGIALGMGYDAAAEAHLFPSLNMPSSYIRVPDTAMANYAWGYNTDNRAIRVNPGMFDGQAYGVKTTTTDFIRFVQANINPETLDASWRQAIIESHRGYFRLNAMTQALAWEMFSYPTTLETLLEGITSSVVMENNPVQPIEPPEISAAPTLFHKTGSTNGFGAYVLFVPSLQIGIVMLANRSYPNAARITAAYTIVQQVLGHSAPE
jgi:beta-lactamase class C